MLCLCVVDYDCGVVFECSVVHASDDACSGFDVCADGAVPLCMLYHLHPHHEYLCECGSSPLSGFEQYDSDG